MEKGIKLLIYRFMKKLYARTLSPSRTLDEATLLEALEERGIIEQIMTTLNLGRISKSDQNDERRETKTEGGRREESIVSPTPRYLHPRLNSPDGKIYVLVTKTCNTLLLLLRITLFMQLKRAR